MTIAEDAVLVLAPPQTDMRVPEQLLDKAGVKRHRCTSIQELAELAPLAGAALIGEESLCNGDPEPLMSMINAQPPWSNFPIMLVIERREEADADLGLLHRLEKLGNVIFVEKPFGPLSFVGNIEALLSLRRRQYRARGQAEVSAETVRAVATGKERQRLLVRELHHRVKNTLATVQALMSSTARSSQTVEEFRQALLGRISALSHAHEALTEDKWQEAPLRDLFAFELQPADSRSFKGTARLQGPDIKVPSHLAVPLGLAIHELTINALRYGSLSQPGGVLDVVWEVEASPNNMMLRIDWRESGGPPLPTPKRRGFGSQFLERVLRQQASADVELDYHPAGMHVVIRLPLPERTHFHLFAEA